MFIKNDSKYLDNGVTTLCHITLLNLRYLLDAPIFAYYIS